MLEGVAQRGADLVEAAEGDTGLALDRLRIDGGMSANPTFVQAVADATQRPVEVSPEREATTLGAGFLAGLAVGTWGGWDDLAATWRPDAVVEPAGRSTGTAGAMRSTGRRLGARPERHQLLGGRSAIRRCGRRTAQTEADDGAARRPRRTRVTWQVSDEGSA